MYEYDMKIIINMKSENCEVLFVIIVKYECLKNLVKIMFFD